jgi:glycosyltransferase involved in cell wall biosynthesis
LKVSTKIENPGIGESSLVSVIIPAHNAERYIDDTLRSVVSQSHSHIEIVIVDDGSTDSTLSMAKDWADRDPRVRVISQPQGGVAAARNRAIEATRGDFIAPLDADDLWFPRKIERQLQRFAESTSEVGVVYTWTTIIDGDNRCTGIMHKKIREGDVFADLLASNIVGHSSGALIRREALAGVGYNLSLRDQGAQGCEDLDVYIRIAEHWLYACVPEFLVAYRTHVGGMSKDYTAMGRSVDRVLLDTRSRHTYIPARAIRLGRSANHMALAIASTVSGNQYSAARQLLTALALDPTQVRFREHRRLWKRIIKWSLINLCQLSPLQLRTRKRSLANSHCSRLADLPTIDQVMRKPDLLERFKSAPDSPFGHYREVHIPDLARKHTPYTKRVATS